MPVAVRVDPFSGRPILRNTKLRTPQARVLAALVPEYRDDPVSEWPLVTRTQLAVKAGYTALSGTVTRVLNGIRAGSSSGEPHPGLLARGFVVEVTLNIDGVSETNYRATLAGVQAYDAHIASGKRLPPNRDAKLCVNDRYRKIILENS